MDNPGQEHSPVASAIIRRILLQRTDLLSKYGPERVGAAVDDVADFVGDTDEIGSSDVSGWVRQVEQMLGNMTEAGYKRDAYQRDYDNSVAGMSKRDSYAYSQDGGGNDERHDLDPTEWYIVKDGKMFKATVYPTQVQSAMSQGFSPSREEAKARADQQGVAEGSDFFAGSKFADEDGNTFSVEKIIAFAKKNPKYFHKDFPLSKIKHDLSWWQGNKERMMNADTSFPLLVIQNDDGHLGVADGLNRMKKAVDVEKKTTIDVYLVPKKDIMKFSEKQGVAEGDIGQLEKDIAAAPVEPIANMEGSNEKIGNMDADAFDSAMARLKKLAGAGPMKTVWDPTKRVYRNMPTAVQPPQQPKK